MSQQGTAYAHLQMKKISIVNETEVTYHSITKNGCGEIKLGLPIDNLPQSVYGVYDKIDKKSRSEDDEYGDQYVVEYYEASISGHPVAEIFDYGTGEVQCIKVLSTNLWVGRDLTLDSTAYELISNHGESVTNDGVLFISYREVQFYGIKLKQSGYEKVSDAYLSGQRPFLTYYDIEPLSRAEYILVSKY